MVSVPRGSRLVLKTADGRKVELLALSDGRIENRAVLRVLALPDAMAIETGSAELPTDHGVVRVPARLNSEEGVLELTVAASVRPLQRRAHVRRPFAFPLRGTASAEPAPLPSADRGEDGDQAAEDAGGTAPRLRIAFHGQTENISTGGLRARLEMDTPGKRVPRHLDEMYVEVDLGGRRPAGTVLQVVSLRSDLLQARFVFIAPADREQLALRLLERG